ncbi:2-oxo acid dehydrogenase subunit E2 [Dactylosporangium sp. CA-052675]|uniref:2-oxo acid dehydrogenase subunit E2 n=1 Tax=Dactylosporangium sp. CA-052675 TaxID=3239927 RepID=UPI003D90EE37
MTEIRVPKLNTNDAEYTLLEWIVPPGTLVREGEPVATVETSKAAEELPASGSGYLQPLLPAGAVCSAGAVIARLAAAPAEPAGSGGSDVPRRPDVTITEPALRAMAERGISRAEVEALGRRVIRVADLDELAPAPGAPREERLSTVQRAVAAVVAESARDVPQAFVAVRVPAEAAVARGRELTRQYRRLIGLPELTIAAIGAVAAEHPDCFAAFVPPDRVRRAARVDIGVTVDVGQGLHVPVIRDVPALSLAGIAERLMALRTTALRGAFRPADLADPAILLALHTDPDVTAAVPLVLPGTTCAVSLTARVDGHVGLGLAYDHRVLNGRGATLFLKAVAATLAV